MTDLSRSSLVIGAAALPALAVSAVAVSAEPDPIIADPVSSAIDRFEAAHKVSVAAMRNGRIGADVVTATDAALRELVFMTPTTEEGRAAQEEYFTMQIIRILRSGVEEVELFCALPGIRDCLRSVEPIKRGVMAPEQTQSGPI
jgi:hypothetical protein